MKTKLTGGLIAILVLVGTSLAAPVVIFEDDFNDGPPGANAIPGGWIVVGGTVDIIPIPGDPLSDFFPGQGYGLYVDLDGSTDQAGMLATAAPILFQTGCTYTLTFDLAGSQLPVDQLIETVWVSFADIGPAPLAPPIPRYWSDGFSTETVVIPGDGLSHQIVFYNLDSDDSVGALLDNVVLTEDCGNTCPVPAPGAVVLGSLGAALVGLFRRRGL
ncbi:MAG: hypothetical protein JW741_16350 [Sedimentisphaerales bacterium]|nr:hypothetical protein [Sedimentisphaerales bacterium]